MASLPSGVPDTGASGQLNVPGPLIESAEPHDEPPEDGDDLVNVPVGEQQHGAPSPAHGAAGGSDVNWASVGPLTFHPDSTSTGMTINNPSFGRSKK